ncbi:TPA: hypothetical protein K0O58_000014 [Legionella pneumophila]|nr:hypothetical protein [Legionella pneumophila]HBD9373337.1 hypothetical protein [Legionella pneumophila]HBI2944965.1 hypothetical protein [Legionella pneumophila]HDV6632072.1 hypothetical protein [Legionella pneumophila]
MTLGKDKGLEAVANKTMAIVCAKVRRTALPCDCQLSQFLISMACSTLAMMENQVIESL